jgi:hypothetical protein
MLEAFESVDDDLEMKKEIAQKIIDTPIKIEKEENREVVKSLKSQLKFYLDPQSVELYNLNPEPTNRNSIYDDLSIDETVFDNFISNIDVNKLIKIADLLELGDRSAESKLQKLSYRLQETIQQYIKDLSDNDIADSETKADAIYQVILDKADLAQQNGKMEEATKLLCKLPPDFLDDVEDSS